MVSCLAFLTFSHRSNEMAIGPSQNALVEKNLESSTRDLQDSCTPKSLWVTQVISEPSCILCPASEEKP